MELSQPWIVDCEEIDDPLDLNFLESDKLESSDKHEKSDEKVLHKTATKGLKKRRIVNKSTCPICGKQFGGHGYLKFHLKNVHKSEWELEKVENIVQLDHNYCANNNNDPSRHCESLKENVSRKYSNKKVLKSGRNKNLPKNVEIIEIPANRKVSQECSSKNQRTPKNASYCTNLVEINDGHDGLKHVNINAPVLEHDGDEGGKVNDVIKWSDCVICPKVSELNELVQTIFTKPELVEMEPYHCVACSKRFTWDWIDALDDEDLISTGIIDPDDVSDPESRTETISFMDNHLTENKDVTENPASNKVTSPVPKKKRRRKRKKKEMFECQYCQRKFKL
jgi:hypothetical protein